MNLSINSNRRGQTQWKYKMKNIEKSGKVQIPQESQSPRPQTKLSTDMSPALIAQANWTFVEKLLKVKLHASIHSHIIINFYCQISITGLQVQNKKDAGRKNGFRSSGVGSRR